MSLFDSIKYPIASPPRIGELEALPNEMYKAWIIISTWANLVDSDSWDAIWVEMWMRDSWNSSLVLNNEIVNDLELLRDLISKW